MKQFVCIVSAALLLCGCRQASDLDELNRVVTFGLTGDFIFTQEPMSRALDADGKSMTDVWVLDYVDGVLKQQVHQVSTDADFGSPQLTLGYGEHHLYFVASRGSEPTLDTDACTLTWARPSDTFWKDYAMTVSGSTGASVAVALDRVVSKFAVTITDAVPSDVSTINIVPSTWYYGMYFTTGLPTDARTSLPRPIAIPSSYAGRTGVQLSIFGFSSSTQWTTDVLVTSERDDESVVSEATISSAPIQRNRVTGCSGMLFSQINTHSITLSTDWGEAINVLF